MLIEFSVSNFLSFKDKVTLSMVPFKSYKEHEGSHVKHQNGPKVPKLLYSAVVYGANASGKTNLFKAMSFMNFIVRRSADETESGKLWDFNRFAIPKEENSSFAITFLVEKSIYQYEFTFARNSIVSEVLSVMDNSPYQRMSPIFHRSEKLPGGIKYGSIMSGERTAIFNKTRNTTLFLSALYKWNQPIAENPFTWIAENLSVILDSSDFERDLLPFTIREIKKSEDFTASVKYIVKNADMDIVNFSIEEQNIIQQQPARQNSMMDVFNKVTGEGLVEVSEKEAKIFRLNFAHNGTNDQNEKIQFQISSADESKGTMKLFSLSGPVIYALSKGYTLVIDELGSSMHPILTRAILSLFHNPEINRKGAQLIFNTHDISLLDRDIFRRDQVWFTEKNLDGSTKLIPLMDYSPRQDEALGARYIGGAYNAIPIINQYNLLENVESKNG